MPNPRIPPPVVAILLGGGAYFSRGFFPKFDHDLLFYAGLGFELLGATITISSALAFAKWKTTMNPLKPREASSLITGGTFALSRNPMYLGMLLFLIGPALQFNPVGGIPMAFLFALYMNAFQIPPEESALSEIFGEEYREYAKKVRRWI